MPQSEVYTLFSVSQQFHSAIQRDSGPCRSSIRTTSTIVRRVAVSLATHTPPVEIESLVKSRAVGYSLEAPFYTSQEVFDLDVAEIFAKHWLFCAAEPEIPDA